VFGSPYLCTAPRVCFNLRPYCLRSHTYNSAAPLNAQELVPAPPPPACPPYLTIKVVGLSLNMSRGTEVPQLILRPVVGPILSYSCHSCLGGEVPPPFPVVVLYARWGGYPSPEPLMCLCCRWGGDPPPVALRSAFDDGGGFPPPSGAGPPPARVLVLGVSLVVHTLLVSLFQHLSNDATCRYCPGLLYMLQLLFFVPSALFCLASLTG
jgi:hypothetical protein